MKNGGSLIVSWLTDIKKCQITQSNWSVTTHQWDLHNEDTIEEVIDSLQEFFLERFNYQIFRNTGTSLQFLQHGEIDVLGLEIKAGTVANLYGVTTDFNETGLNIGNNALKIEKILRKMIRTALLFHGYYSQANGTIIYAAPKLSKIAVEQLADAVQVLNEVFKIYGFQFSFLLYINEVFYNQILFPVENLEKSARGKTRMKVGVVSEKKMIVPEKEKIVQENVDNSRDKLKIGLLVRSEMDQLIINGRISDELIQQLLDTEYSNETFGLNYPLLKKVVKDQSMVEQRKVNGYERYWNKLYIINGGKYLICKEWYEKQRAKFINWIDLFDRKVGK